MTRPTTAATFSQMPITPGILLISSDLTSDGISKFAVVVRVCLVYIERVELVDWETFGGYSSYKEGG